MLTATTARPCPDVVVADGGPRHVAASSPADGTLALAWLGQAGFLLQTAGRTIAIDPYLSDFLARKYRGREFAHERLMAAPLSAMEIPRLDLVLCTHRHSDHMDPDTLTAIVASHPRCRFVVPAADLEHASGLGLPADRLLPIDAGEHLPLGDDLAVTAVPAAHEALERDAAGRCRYLGYVVRTGGLAVYHSGDTVVFPELPGLLAGRGIDYALLPVNGRDAYRASRGVPGNMRADEALALCAATGIPLLVPHHFGMFSFNTATPEDLERLRRSTSPRTILPDLDHHLVLTPSRTAPT